MRLMLLLLWTLVCPAWGALNILTCEPEWGALARELGGDQARVTVATTALQDPHRIEARPSLISRARAADLVVCTGAELEIGWLPLLQQQSGNPKIQLGQPGFFEAAPLVPLVRMSSTVFGAGRSFSMNAMCERGTMTRRST